MRRSGSLCDAIISVKSQTFKAHRLVLACASRRLAQQLAQGDADCPVHCTLEYFSPRTFQQVLDFTYTQALEVPVDDLHLLLRAARLLEMQPLEDQCRKQLDTLDYKETAEDEKSEITDVKEEAKSADEKKDVGSVQDVEVCELQQTSSSVEEANDSIVRKNLTPSNLAKSHSGSPLPRKKPRLSPTASSYNRDSVITRPASSSSSFASSQTFSTNMWNSISTLRQIAENYSNLLAVHPLQSPNQPPVAYPLSLSSPHMFPLLRPHFQNNAVVGYSSLYSPYPQNLYAGDILKQGPLKRKKEFNGVAQSHEPR